VECLRLLVLLLPKQVQLEFLLLALLQFVEVQLMHLHSFNC